MRYILFLKFKHNVNLQHMTKSNGPFHLETNIEEVMASRLAPASG